VVSRTCAADPKKDHEEAAQQEQMSFMIWPGEPFLY
jgi:hypothetical protein